MDGSRIIHIMTGAAAIGLVGLAVWFGSRASRVAAPNASGAATGGDGSAGLSYAGRAACTACHEAEETRWRGSHHDLAMQEATEATVLGDFSGVSFTYHEVTTTFVRKGAEFFARTDGPDGALQDYRIAYTYGVYPLQQYLIEFPGGRYQALNVCWDARPKEQGGQRWFHLYPDENVTSQDILHWTGPYQNWNHMCAECHSTNVHKNYDAAKDAFATSWSEIDVSCEACHGPASGHIAWARRNSKAGNSADPAASTLGFAARLGETKPGTWLADPTTGIAKRDHPRTNQVESEMCARCHSRRGTFSEDVLPGRPPADTHRLALLRPSLYEADGQIKDEVYEYGSFLQSRMYAAGVTCSDCHEPHSLKTAPGNGVCARCHTPDKFDTPAHHFHAPGGKGSACVECHMPTRNYMVVHARHDHSLRVPRPDLTVSIGTPNACNGCHADRTPQWAAEEIARRLPGKSRRPHFGEALAAGTNGKPGEEALLNRLLGDASQPAIARATAAEMLGGAENQRQVIGGLVDASPLVRGAAVNALNPGDAKEFVGRLGPLMSDPVRQVRMDAARRLATVDESLLTPEQRAARERGMQEYLAAQQLDADRAEAHLNLGALHAERGEFEAAEKEYLAALRLSPRFPAAYVNLGDLYRQQKRDDDAVRVLKEGLEKSTGSADIPHALGLALVRGGRLGEALPQLERAATLAPAVTRYAYVYAVALESAGPPGRGIDVLKRAHERHPNDCDVLVALVTYCRGVGRMEDAVDYAGRLLALRPDDQSVRAMVDQINAERKGGLPVEPPKR